MTGGGLTVLIAAAIFLPWLLTAAVLLRRFDGSHETPRRAHPSGRPRAWGTRARRSAHAVYRRAGTTWRHARAWARAEWAGLGDTDPGRIVWEHPCDCERCRDNPDGPVMLPADAPDGAHDSVPPSDLPGGGGPQAPPSPVPVRQPARKATGAELRWHLTERDAAPLDYAPAPPFAAVLSDDTLARDIPAVKP